MVSVNTERLEKILAHLDNDNDGEAFNAMSLLRRELAKSGYKMRDLPTLLGKSPGAASAKDSAPPKHRATQRKARRRADEEAARRRAKAEQELRRKRRPALVAEREALIARFGSEKAAWRPTGLERSIRTAFAVASYERRRDCARNGLDHNDDWDEETSPELIAAIRKPGPFPTSVTAAHAECEYWDKRASEYLLLAWNEEPRGRLCRPCAKRRQMVRDAFAYDLRAVTSDEIELRRKAVLENPDAFDVDRMQQAILADMKHLTAKPSRQNQHVGHRN